MVLFFDSKFNNYSMSINLLRESPSVLFCASDGKRLRVYQVVCNAKALLTSQISYSKVSFFPMED